jgi:hypothetical protein
MLGWWIWIPTATLFSAYLIRIRTSPPRQSYVPLVFTGLWLASSLAHYFRSDWHQYWGRHVVWFSGMVAILAAAFVPLFVTLVVERATTRVVQRPVWRGCLAAATAMLVTLFVQKPLGMWIGVSIIHKLQ